MLHKKEKVNVLETFGIKESDTKHLNALFNKLKIDNCTMQELDKWVQQNYIRSLEIINTYYKNVTSKRNMILSLAHAICKLSSYEKDDVLKKQVEKLQVEYKVLSDRHYKQVGDQQFTKHQADNFVPYHKLIQKRDIIKMQLEISNTQKLNYMYVLLSMVTMHPPLRRKNYADLEIITNKNALQRMMTKEEKLPSKGRNNYIYCDMEKSKVYYYLYNDKVIESHGSQIIEYDNDLSQIIIDSITNYPRKYLFSSTKDPLKPSGKFSIQKIIYDMFNAEKLRVSMNLIRIAYVMDYYAKYQGNKERQYIALKMRHSVAMAYTTYNKCRETSIYDHKMLPVTLNKKGVPLSSLHTTKQETVPQRITLFSKINQDEPTSTVTSKSILDNVKNTNITNQYYSEQLYSLMLYLENIDKKYFTDLVLLKQIAQIICSTYHYCLFELYYTRFNIGSQDTALKIWDTVESNNDYNISTLREIVSKENTDYVNIQLFDYPYWIDQLFLNEITSNNVITYISKIYYGINYNKYIFNYDKSCMVVNNGHFVVFTELQHDDLKQHMKFQILNFVMSKLKKYYILHNSANVDKYHQIIAILETDVINATTEKTIEYYKYMINEQKNMNIVLHNYQEFIRFKHNILTDLKLEQKTNDQEPQKVQQEVDTRISNTLTQEGNNNDEVPTLKKLTKQEIKQIETDEKVKKQESLIKDFLTEYYELSDNAEDTIEGRTVLKNFENSKYFKKCGTNTPNFYKMASVHYKKIKKEEIIYFIGIKNK